MPSDGGHLPLSRREVLGWIARAALLAGVPAGWIEAGGPLPARDAPLAQGYGRDPNLMEPRSPWPLTLTEEQRLRVSQLADWLLPADAHGPAPSEIGIGAFIDEWISAPYPDQQSDRKSILAGLALPDAQTAAGIERLARQGADEHGFFANFRRVCVLGYYTSTAGMADIGHVVPTPAAGFAGPPPQVRARLGV